MPRYAVTGSTGPLGHLIVSELLARGVAPRDIVAVARTPAKASHLAEAGVDVRQGDYSDAASLLSALHDVERLLLVSDSDVGPRLRQHLNVIDAAVTAGVAHLIYTRPWRL